MKLNVEAINSATFAKVWEERGGVLLYPEDHPVVLRALKIAEALDAQLETLKGNLEIAKNNRARMAEDGRWKLVEDYNRMVGIYQSAVDSLEDVKEKGDPVE